MAVTLSTMSYTGLQTELELEKHAHRVTDELYNKAMDDLKDLNNELVRVNAMWAAEVKQESEAVREARQQIEVLLREKEAARCTVHELEERLREAETDVSDTHKRLSEAVVTATNAASKIESSEQTCVRLRQLVTQLEHDTTRIRDSKDIEITNYRSDLEASQAEYTALTERLRHSEAARLEQSRCLEEVARIELQVCHTNREPTLHHTAPLPQLQTYKYNSQVNIEECRDVAEGMKTSNQDLEREVAVLRQRTLDMDSTHALPAQPLSEGEPASPSYAQLAATAHECSTAVGEMGEQLDRLSKRLAELTGCVLDMSRSDSHILGFIDTLRGDMRNKDELEEDNDRLMKLVQKATDQMAAFSESVSKAEAEELEAIDREFEVFCARSDLVRGRPPPPRSRPQTTTTDQSRIVNSFIR